jgi:exosortase/archaeosortase family protein
MENLKVIFGRKINSNKVTIVFIIKLFALYFLLVTVNKLAYSATLPTGRFYNQYFSTHFDYIQGLRSLIIIPATYLVKAVGLTAAYNDTDIMVINGPILRINYECLGLNVFSFLIAFAVAFPSQLSAKVRLLTITILTVYLLNVIRIAGLAILLSFFPSQQVYFNYHHEIFNIVVYTVIFFMLYFWIKKNAPLAYNKVNS